MSRSPLASYSRSIIVGNEACLPVVAIGSALLPTRPFHLSKILLLPNIVKNLILVRQFTRENLVSVKFDHAGFSVKDLVNKALLLRCNSGGDLYPFSSNNGRSSPMVLTVQPSNLSQTWPPQLIYFSSFSP